MTGVEQILAPGGVDGIIPGAAGIAPPPIGDIGGGIAGAVDGMVLEPLLLLWAIARLTSQKTKAAARRILLRMRAPGPTTLTGCWLHSHRESIFIVVSEEDARLDCLCA
jgi:hypothetical protein